MNKVKTKDLKQAMIDITKIGVSTDDYLTMVFGKDKTAIKIRKFDQGNNLSTTNFGIIIDGSNEEEGVVAIDDIKEFKQAIKQIKAKEVEFELTDQEIIVNSGVYETRYSEFKVLPIMMMNYDEITVDGKEFLESYKQAYRHVSLDPRYSWLNMIYNEVKGGKLKVSASDAYTAGLTSMPCSSEVGDVSFYVVYSAARTLAKLKGKEVKIGVNAQGENWYTRFIIDDKYLIESSVGKFEKYDKIKTIEEVIRTNNYDNPIEFTVDDLAKLVKEVKEKGYNNGKYQSSRACKLVNLRLKEGKLRTLYEVKEGDVSKFTSTKEQPKYEVKGDFDLNIYFNIEYLDRYLKGLKRYEGTTKVTLSFQDELDNSRPSVRQFKVSIENRDNFVGVIAPVRMQER